MGHMAAFDILKMCISSIKDLNEIDMLPYFIPALGMPFIELFLILLIYM